MSSEGSPIHYIQRATPDILEAWMNLSRAIRLREGGLSRFEVEAIATHVSRVNRCEYCTEVHRSTMHDLRCDISPVRYSNLMSYSELLTRKPGTPMTAKMMVPQLTDEERAHAVAVICHYNHNNRLVNAYGLGTGAAYRDPIHPMNETDD